MMTLGAAASLCAVAVIGPTAQEAAKPSVLDAPPAPFKLTLSTTGLPAEGRWKSAPVLRDINKDGLVDLILHPRLLRHTYVWQGDGKGNWKDSFDGLDLTRNTTCGGKADVADLNGDGNLDIAVADHCDGVFVFLGDGKGSWKPTNKKAMNNAEAAKHEEDGENPWSGAEAMAVGDVNGDKFADLVVAASDRGGFTVYFGDGTGTNWTEQPYVGLPNTEQPGEGEEDMAGWSRDVLLVDVNNDKHLDVVAAYHRGPRVWLGDGKGKFTTASKGLPAPLLYGIFQQIAVADMNRDKRLDVLTSNTINGPEVFLQNADGTWQPTADVMPAMLGGATAVAAGDLDGDGILDIVTGGRAVKSGQFGIFALRGDGKGGFSLWKTEMPDGGQQVVWGLTVGDVNGDKRNDIIASLGGAMGAAGTTAGTAPELPDVGKIPHVQVWLNQPK
jgi:hypothetical protein